MSATKHEVVQEPDELSRRKIALVTAGSLLTTILALAGAWILLERWGHEARHGAPPVAPRTIGILEQTLVLATERGLELRKRQASELDAWEWIDRDGGIAKIPISVAMDVLATSPPPVDRPLEPKRSAPVTP